MKKLLFQLVNNLQSWTKLLRHFNFNQFQYYGLFLFNPLPHFNVVALWKRCENEAGWISYAAHWAGGEEDKNVSTRSLFKWFAKNVWYCFVSTSFVHDCSSSLAVAQWLEHPTGVRKVIHGFHCHSCRGLRFFICPTLVTNWNNIFLISFTELITIFLY